MNNQARYFFIDDLRRLRDSYASLPDTEREALKTHVALNCPDPETAMLVADITGDDWAHIYPAAEKARPVSTVDAIDTFLETYGHSSPEEYALLEKLIFNPTPDYTGVLEAEDAQAPAEAPDDLTTERIDSFIAAHPAATPRTQPATPRTQPATPEAPVSAPAQTPPPQVARKPAPQKTPAPAQKTPAAPSSLSESLAKIYIKQGRYERAYEIISDLNLKNPEKSIYFADQLRFLRKLMLIRQSASGPAATAQADPAVRTQEGPASNGQEA